MGSLVRDYFRLREYIKFCRCISYSCSDRAPASRAFFILGLFDNATHIRQSQLMAKPALGRGLGALLGGVSPMAKPSTLAPTSPPQTGSEPAADQGERVRRLSLDQVRPCPFQPRKDFTAETLQELADEA